MTWINLFRSLEAIWVEGYAETGRASQGGGKMSS